MGWLQHAGRSPTLIHGRQINRNIDGGKCKRLAMSAPDLDIEADLRAWWAGDVVTGLS